LCSFALTGGASARAASICRSTTPTQTTLGYLLDHKGRERSGAGSFEKLPYHFMEISNLLLKQYVRPYL
jgi:hypothetical protein